MLGDVNSLFAMLMVMLLFSVIMDGFTFFNILVKKSDAAIEYACIGLKWLKIIMVFIFAAVMIFYSFTVANTAFMTIAEFVLGLLLLADGVLSVIVKRKYGGKK